jgi:hypothetical protein
MYCQYKERSFKSKAKLDLIAELDPDGTKM